MVGGETAVRMGSGEIIKLQGAAIGGAVMMAGGYLEHAALRAENCSERLSLVNSYAFADPDADDSATTIKSINLSADSVPAAMNNIMSQKLVRLLDRSDLAIAKIAERREKGEAPSREEVKGWVRD